MTVEMHPQVAEAMRQARLFQSALEDQQHRRDTETFSATDESETVEVTLNARLCLTGLHIEDGLLRLGAETVMERINEAIGHAQAAATEEIDAEHERLIELVAGIAGSLKETLGLT
ncbi:MULTISPECIES: YbaB/EbfC family nucleoid-associated protein [unclassified Mycobacterium]|uniref:YbaB/EbfC family nucleoid-associated protein n=1 Tax=unclassified Mycobacterium TaxID=2642494 RepID=UPI0006DC1C20|nr:MULTISPECIES: YbaB/EbfC family nucleoid-associated protein [unclassified Mycobacterium]OBF13492.1 DNA-binding protein [Mycobacterium sp. ACS4054]OBG61124.1 DNA-binding protein [Mycobacterium sp. E3339]OBH83489.1 DNA-binding protein [Mycobacterium sp. E2989]